MVVRIHSPIDKLGNFGPVKPYTGCNLYKCYGSYIHLIFWFDIVNVICRLPILCFLVSNKFMGQNREWYAFLTKCSHEWLWPKVGFLMYLMRHEQCLRIICSQRQIYVDRVIITDGVLSYSLLIVLKLAQGDDDTYLLHMYHHKILSMLVPISTIHWLFLF